MPASKHTRPAYLPRTLLDELHRLFRQAASVAVIRAHLAKAGSPVARDQLIIYRDQWRERQAATEELMEVAALAREGNLDLRDLAADLAAAAAVKAAATAERGLLLTGDAPDPEQAAYARSVDTALARAERLQRLVRNMEAGARTGQDRRDDAERRGDLAEAGMTDDALRRARQMAGLAPTPTDAEDWDDAAYGPGLAGVQAPDDDAEDGAQAPAGAQ